MRVLIVARFKEKGFAPFVEEQVAALEKAGMEYRYFPMLNKGITGYLRQLPTLRRVISEFHPDVIHAHYGLCGLFANLQRRVPVVTTYHGSDINQSTVLRLSRVAIRLSAFNIFVSRKNEEKASPRSRYSLIPCGINIEDYPPMGKEYARQKMGMAKNQKYVLFAGAFDNPVKNASLAHASVALLNDVELIELKGYTRQQVATLMQAVDALLVTSLMEGSPQVVKEAMASCCPIVSVDVGDVKERISGIKGCFISDYSPSALAACLQKVFLLNQKTTGRESIIIQKLDNDSIAQEIISVYKQVVSAHTS